MLNLFFFVGFIRQASNLKQNMTTEIFVECCIKVIVGNWLLTAGISLMRLFFEMASELSGGILLDDTMTWSQTDMDAGAMVFYRLLFGVIFFCTCLVCSVMIFLAVYGRFLQLYLLVAIAPFAVSTLPGGPGISQSASAWIRTFLAKTFEIVLIALTLAIGARLCNAIDFGSFADSTVGSLFDGFIQGMQNIATMILITASVKGVDAFMRRSLAL